MKNVGCEYDRWVVETELCKLRDTSDTLIWCACAMLQLKYGVCEYIDTGCTQFGESAIYRARSA